MAVRLRVTVGEAIALHSRDIERLEYVQELGRHDRATVRFYRDTTHDAVTIDKVVGLECRVEVIDTDLDAEGKDDPAKVDFEGVVIDAEQSPQLNGGSHWRLEVASRSIFLERDRSTRVVAETDLGGLARQLWPAIKVDAGTPQREAFVQWGETDWDFLVRAADDHGLMVRQTKGQIEVRQGFERTAVPLTWGDDLLALAVRATPRNSGAHGWAYEAAKKESFVFRDRREEPAFMGTPALANTVRRLAKSFPVVGDAVLVADQARAGTLSDFRERLGTESRRTLGGTIVVEGATTSHALRVGATLRVQTGGGSSNGSAGLPGLVGELGVVRLASVWDGQQYRNEFLATPWEEFSNFERPARPVVHGVVSGEVVDVEDPRESGRVKVRLHWQGGEDPLLWMRMVAPFAGNERGVQFFPEIGDEVVVAFEEGDPERPYALGAVWNGRDFPPDLKYKQIVTRSGNTIRIGDESGEEIIQIFTPGGTCMLQLQNASAGPTLTVHSEGDISIEAKEELRIKCKNLVQEVESDYLRKAGNSEKAAANGAMTFTATNLDLSADANASLSAGAMLDASAGAIHNVVGALVQLNPPAFVKRPVMKAQVRLKSSYWSQQDIRDGDSPYRSTLETAPKRGVSGAPPAGTPFARPLAATGGAAAAGGGAGDAAAGTEAGPTTDWIEIEMVDPSGKPVQGVRFHIELPDGSQRDGVLDEKGRARYDGIEAGQCRISFPDLDKDAWEPA